MPLASTSDDATGRLWEDFNVRAQMQDRAWWDRDSHPIRLHAEAVL